MANWNALTYAFGSQLNTTKLGQNHENFTAVTEGATGAPRILSAGLGSACVGQGKLLTATASGSQSGSGASITYTLTGGTYSWWTASVAGATTTEVDTGQFGGTDTSAGVLGFYNASGISRTVHVDERYVQSSPPYDLGDGEIPLFVFLLMNKDGTIAGTQVAQDPPWANNGPTCVTAQHWDGKRWLRKYKRLGFGGPLLSDLLASRDAAKLKAYLRGELQVVEEWIELCQVMKNRDMGAVPHPFGNVAVDQTVVLLDPFANGIVERLAFVQREIGAREVRQLLLDGALRVDNQLTPMLGPPGVVPVRATWR